MVICKLKVTVLLKIGHIWEFLGNLCPEVVVTLNAIWKWGISKQGILKNHVFRFLSISGWIVTIFDLAHLCHFVENARFLKKIFRALKMPQSNLKSAEKKNFDVRKLLKKFGPLLTIC